MSTPAGPSATPRAAAALTVLATAITGWCAFHGALSAHLLATAAFCLVVHRVLTGRYQPSFGEALAIAIALRVVCLPHPPSLSDDVFRYLHEGNLVLAGENPYLTAPADTDPSLRGAYFDQINNPGIPAAYPPAVQYALAGGVLLSPNPLGMKLVFGFFDLLVFVVLWRLLSSQGLPPARALVHGCCPLMAVEFAGQGHSDSLAVLFIALTLLAVQSTRPAIAGLCLGVATAGKLLPAVLLPFVSRSAGSPIRSGLSFVAILAALYAPFLVASADLFRGTLEYTARWRSNDSLFAAIHGAAEGVIASGWLDAVGPAWLQEPQRLAKIPLALLGLAVLGRSWLHGHPPQRAAYLFFVFFVAASPTVHPWYVAFLMPFLCIYPNWGFLVFTGTVFLAYHVLPAWLAERRWEEQLWIKVLEYLPFYGGVVLLCRRSEARPRSERKPFDRGRVLP